jgi:hypothetical protein
MLKHVNNPTLKKYIQAFNKHYVITQYSTANKKNLINKITNKMNYNNNKLTYSRTNFTHPVIVDKKLEEFNRNKKAEFEKIIQLDKQRTNIETQIKQIRLTEKGRKLRSELQEKYFDVDKSYRILKKAYYDKYD